MVKKTTSYQEALTDFNKGNFEKAIMKFKLYLENYPEDPDAYFYIGKAYLNLKDFRNSLLYLRKVVELVPKDEDTWRLMESMYRAEFKDLERAELCKNKELPKIPCEGCKDLITEKTKKVRKMVPSEKLKLPLVIIDDNLLIRIFDIKKENIFHVFKQATEIFNFVTSNQMYEDFVRYSKYENEEFSKLVSMIPIGSKDLQDFEKYLFEICPDSKRVKESHKIMESWYSEITLPYIFLKQNAKKIIIVCEENTLQKVCKDLKFNCILMNSQKFWAYLRYKIKRHFPDFYDMWL